MISFKNYGLGGSSGGRVTAPQPSAVRLVVPSLAVVPTFGPRCFNCRELGHRFTDCKKGSRKGLFADSNKIIHEQLQGYDSKPVYDREEVVEEEHF
ncbi:hypothetical protein LWI28_028506 [Acer negundo]|uniref:CCHC-type domain-containing protein n=1 Tax=Acer negundo TaxID=4023 RepID=A0AAD5NYV0_ACENE|nr:hypothetical protein LWI28_028506 [Acer negundo]